MTLLESTYTQLRNAQLVHCAEAFSQNYLNKNHNWYAYQKHTGRDYSVGAAIQCLRNIRSQQRDTAISTAQQQTLKATEQQLHTFLTTQHCVADVC